MAMSFFERCSIGKTIELLSNIEAKKMIDQNLRAKIKATNTYNAASDHFDDKPLSFGALYGRKTVERLNLKPGRKNNPI